MTQVRALAVPSTALVLACALAAACNDRPPKPRPAAGNVVPTQSNAPVVPKGATPPKTGTVPTTGEILPSPIDKSGAPPVPAADPKAPKTLKALKSTTFIFGLGTEELTFCTLATDAQVKLTQAAVPNPNTFGQQIVEFTPITGCPLKSNRGSVIKSDFSGW